MFASSLIDFFPLGIAAGGVKIWYNYGMRKILLVSAAAISAISAFANSWDDVLLKGRTDNENLVGYKCGEEIVFRVEAYVKDAEGKAVSRDKPAPGAPDTSRPTASRSRRARPPT